MFVWDYCFSLFEKLSYEDTSWPLLTVFHARSDGELMGMARVHFVTPIEVSIHLIESIPRQISSSQF